MYPKEEKEQLFQQLQSIGWSQSALERVFAGLNNEQGKTVSEEGDYLQEAVPSFKSSGRLRRLRTAG